MNKFLLSVLSLTLVSSSIAIAQQAEAQEEPASAPTAATAASMMAGRWSLDMAAGMAAAENIPEEERAARVEGVTGINMMLVIGADGTYETSMDMAGTTYQRPGQWTIESQTDSMVRLAIVADDRADDTDRPPDYITLTFESADQGVCVMESDGYPIPMVRVAE